MSSTPIIKRFIIATCVCLISAVAFAQGDSSQNFKYAIFNYPLQFIHSGLKIGADFNVGNKFQAQLYANHVFTQHPRSYFVDDRDNTLGLIITPHFINKSSMGLMVKHQLGAYGSPYHGYYFLAFVENGRGTEAFWTQFASFWNKTYLFDKQKFNKFGVGFGRQWTLFDMAIMDINSGLGYYNTDVFTKTFLPPSFEGQNRDQVYFFTSVSMGIGHGKSIKAKNKIDDKFQHAITLDFNAMLKNGIEIGYFTGNKGKGLWQFFGRYGSHEPNEINISTAERFTTYKLGVQYRYYPTAGSKKEGMYYALSYASTHTRAEIWERPEIKEPYLVVRKYDPQQVGFAMGFNYFIQNAIMVDFYILNAYTYSPGVAFRPYPHPDEATGIHTIVGLKLGIAQIRRNGN